MKSTEDLEVQTGPGMMPAYCAVPATPPPWPGAVGIHDFSA
jgi:carboxymethylenebutenolidase